MDIKNTVAQNIKSAREQRSLTLEEASSLTGVSKSMLSQIEKGVSNPTISVLWKIADGYKIPFSALLNNNSREASVVKLSDVMPVKNETEGFVNYPVFPYDGEKKFEAHYVTAAPGALQESEAHLPGTEEYITVFSGAVTITVEEKTYQLPAGYSLHFMADRPHSYQNFGDSNAVYYDLIYYK
jgi:transcriptional regulator with XRE-family HTH domain